MHMRNRFVRAATAESLCTKEGAPSKRMIDLYRGLVKGGVGMIITGYAYVTEDGKASERSTNLSDDSALDELTELVKAVHAPVGDEVNPLDVGKLRPVAPKLAHDGPHASDSGSGTRIIAQLVYGGSKSKLAADDPRHLSVDEQAEDAPLQPNVDIVGPSVVAHMATGLVPRQATAEDIERITQAFAAAAARAKRAGFDGVEIHAAHGYLLSQFLDGRFNKRTDEYGGTLENRARFALECVKAVRAEVGLGYPVLVKLNSCDVLGDPQGAQGGLSEEESLRVAEWLVEAGASCIEVSGDWHAVEPEDITGEPFFGSYATRLARRISAPVILTGGWRDPEVIERYLETTGITAVGMARPLICQPFLPELWSSGTLRVAECASCNFCARHNGIPCIMRKGR